jgi:hypothetical protein
MAWFSRLRNKAIALRAIELTKVNRALSTARFCSRQASNGRLNLEQRSAYPLRMQRIGMRGNMSEISVNE